MGIYRKITLARLVIIGLLLILLPAPTLGQDRILILGQPTVADGEVTVDVELRNFFTRDSLASLQAGMPATLVFQWTIRQYRPGWADLDVATGQVRNRIFFDVLEEQYHLFNHQGRPLGACEAFSGVTEALCMREGMVLAGADGLAKGTQYYVKMEVILEILSDEKVRGFEEWLLGDGGNAAVLGDRETTSALVTPEEEDSDFSSGLSDLFLGMVLKITGISDETIQSQSPLFWGGS